jgi:hypothetical protein
MLEEQRRLARDTLEILDQLALGPGLGPGKRAGADPAPTADLPSMDASRPARVFVASGARVSAAAIHPVSTAPGRRPR